MQKLQQADLFELPPEGVVPQRPIAGGVDSFLAELKSFREFGKETQFAELPLASGETVPVFINEFWTAKQRDAHSLHEVSYRACFKPQLPRFFIERLTRPGDVVYDPFTGRGTTLLEAALLGRAPRANDLNPLSRMLLEPRLCPPDLASIQARLTEIDFTRLHDAREDLLVFYHPETLRQITALREYFLRREQEGALDLTDKWIRMVATNRLTGHSPGFFSVYTLPPNQAVSMASQKRINEKRNQEPVEKDVPAIILKKSRQLLKDYTADDTRALAGVFDSARFTCASADATSEIPSDSVSLVVTSPPFLNIVQYQTDNWLRGWFCGIDTKQIPIWESGSMNIWTECMLGTMRELHRVLQPGGHVAFEVGEIRKGKVLLEEVVAKVGVQAGLKPLLVLINSQVFTKTSNCWGIDNLSKGTNTNRIVLFEKTAG